jgi:hypothetical protein
MPLRVTDYHPHTRCALEAFEGIPERPPRAGEKCAEEAAIAGGRRFQFGARSYRGT